VPFEARSPSVGHGPASISERTVGPGDSDIASRKSGGDHEAEAHREMGSC
jgi:hypothetical protein